MAGLRTPEHGAKHCRNLTPGGHLNLARTGHFYLALITGACGINIMSNTEFDAALSMPHPQDSPKYWQRWLEDRGVAEAVARHVNDLYRASRSAGERVWTFAYTGATSGAVIGVLAAAIFIRWASGRWPGWPGLAIMVLAAALAASLA